MVLQKRLDYGFNGYQVPPAPRAPRSARRRGTVRKRVQEDQICAFDLLATVAGDILLKKEGSPSSCNASSEKDRSAILEQDCPEGNIALKMEVCDHESCDRKYFVSELVSPCAEEKLCSKESSTPQDEKAPCDDDSSGSASVLTTSNCSESLAFDKLSNCKIMDDMGSVCKVELGSSEYMASVNCKLDKEGKTLVKQDSQSSEEVLIGTEVDMCSSEDPVVWHVEPLALVKSHSSAKVPMCGDITPHRPFPVNRDDVKVVSRDDDENSSGCTHPSTAFKYSKPMPRNGDRRIRKILASKCWKVATKLKDETHLNPDKDVKPIYHNKKDCNKRPRSQMNIPFKKRKLFEHSSFSKTDGCIKGKDYYESHKMGFGPASIACSKFLGTGGSCSLAGQNTSFQSKDSHVKLQIKSFRVPELFIEIPETATVASLKRTVMEAVTKILGGGLHVGVRVQGKKVRDDNKTLLQTGISNENQLGSLGFSLEPNPSKSSSFLYPVDSPHLFARGASQHLTRHQSNPSMVHQGTSDNLKEPHIANLESFVESDHDSAPSPINTSVEKNTTESKAIVPMQAMNVDALAMVPAHHKSKRSEIAQRRIRRPFSVSEVEALVQAVERLGTGRWRDVKLRAFDNAKHRTYVDLKDKWKTLVHTARISPQQRRGEPVPQELLDRVLNAHAYWSKQQAKQQPDTCLSSEMCLE